MKITIILLLQIIAYSGSIASLIWAIVEFVLYLVKDKAFNWMSIWMILICMSIGIVFFIISVFLVKRIMDDVAKTENYSKLSSKILRIKKLTAFLTA